MLTITKHVYYCEHCKRHRLTPQSIENHEPRCLYNPARSRCGWCAKDPAYRCPEPHGFALIFKDDPDLAWLRKEMEGCPACMLAVIVQARRLGLSPEEAWEFDYRAEVEKWREAERESERYADVYW